MKHDMDKFLLESIEYLNTKHNLIMCSTIMDTQTKLSLLNESVFTDIYKSSRKIFRTLRETYKKFKDFFNITDMKRIYEEYKSVADLEPGDLDKKTMITVNGALTPYDAIVFTYNIMIDNEFLESIFFSKNDFKSKWITEWKKYNILNEDKVNDILLNTLDGFNKFNPSDIVIGESGDGIYDDIKRVYDFDKVREVPLPEALQMIKDLGRLDFDKIHSKFVYAVGANTVMCDTFYEIEKDLEKWEKKIDKVKDKEFYEATMWRRILATYMHTFMAHAVYAAYGSLTPMFDNIKSMCSQIRIEIQGK